MIKNSLEQSKYTERNFSIKVRNLRNVCIILAACLNYPDKLPSWPPPCLPPHLLLPPAASWTLLLLPPEFLLFLLPPSSFYLTHPAQVWLFVRLKTNYRISAELLACCCQAGGMIKNLHEFLLDSEMYSPIISPCLLSLSDPPQFTVLSQGVALSSGSGHNVSIDLMIIITAF